MKNNRWIKPVSMLTVLSAGASYGAAERPNVLIIITDDMRYDLMTHEGHPYIQTPNLDRLAAEGVRFTQAYASTPLCGPCRMSILSGRLPPAHGRVDNFYYPQDFDIYFPADFHNQGYRTAMIGKYYEGNVFERKVQSGVYDFWFKEDGPDMSKFSGKTGTREYADFRNKYHYYDQAYEVGDTVKVIKGHQTDILFSETANFAVQKPGQPFLTVLSPFAPHAPCNPTLRRKGKYTGKGIWMKDNIEFGAGYMSPARVKQMSEVYERNCEMVEDIDEGVGTVLQALEKSGQLDNTIIIFTADNGVMFGEHGFGWKRHPWQESVRVPLMIRYPKAVKPGSVCAAAVTLADLFPTCAELTGVKLPADSLCYGKSMVSLLTGKETELRKNTLFMQYEKGVQGQYDVRPENLEWVSLIRDDGWKLIRYRVGPPEEMNQTDYGKTFLFNLKSDPLEMRNQAENPENRAIIEEMTKTLVSELKENKATADWL
jgi:arylsulfatase A-like enzyme